jgi:hypothetical protein
MWHAKNGKLSKNVWCTQINGTGIKAPPDITKVLDEAQIGQQVQVKVLRASDGKGQQEVVLTAELASE